MLTIIVKKVSVKLSRSGSKKGSGEGEDGKKMVKMPKGIRLSIDTNTLSKWSTTIRGWSFFTSSASTWGKMYVKMADLTRSERRHSFRHRPSFVGPFRYSHRALIPISDGRAWHHRQSSMGGTVLVDKSGSMSITQQQILDFLRKRPMATVAIYEGSNDNQEGILTIIAKSNKYTTIIPEYGGGNVIDGPALKWLARQDRPRVWVCDGGLTGVGDWEANEEMRVEALVTMKRANIKKVRYLYQAEEVL